MVYFSLYLPSGIIFNSIHNYLEIMFPIDVLRFSEFRTMRNHLSETLVLNDIQITSDRVHTRSCMLSNWSTNLTVFHKYDRMEGWSPDMNPIWCWLYRRKCIVKEKNRYYNKHDFNLDLSHVEYAWYTLSDNFMWYLLDPSREIINSIQ